MKKIIYISGSASIIILMVMFYFNIAGGKEGSELKSLESQTENSLQSIGRVEQSNSPQSGGWQLQTMPNMGNRLVRDLYFTDSLTGYAVASPESYTDSAHILKTTNGGFNWSIKYTSPGRLPRIIFINSNTGFAGGNKLLKTTNAGENWIILNKVFSTIVRDMLVFGEDTLWYGDSDPFAGGAFRTTNGGLNWEKRDSGIPANSYPFYIYFYNSRIGFATGNTNVYKTTNAGLSWNLAFTGGASKLYFRDSLNGYRTSQGFFRTTNGGLNWSKDSLPSVIGPVYTNKWVTNFYQVNKDTLYAVGARIQFITNFIYKGIVYKSTNGGLNWGYQVPDTSYGSAWFDQICAIRNNVWMYTIYNNRGIYTATGGDSTIYVGINQVSNEIPNEFELYQNYPNPFNSITNIQFQVSLCHSCGGRNPFVKLVVYDISGKEVRTLVNGKYQPGTYQVSFNAEGLASGIYFYKMTAGDFSETKKLILIK